MHGFHTTMPMLTLLDQVVPEVWDRKLYGDLTTFTNYNFKQPLIFNSTMNFTLWQDMFEPIKGFSSKVMVGDIIVKPPYEECSFFFFLFK